MSEVAPGARNVEVRGRLFKFDPERTSVTAGEDVAIMLTSEGSEHDFKVEGVEGPVSAAKGKTATGGSASTSRASTSSTAA